MKKIVQNMSYKKMLLWGSMTLLWGILTLLWFFLCWKKNSIRAMTKNMTTHALLSQESLTLLRNHHIMHPKKSIARCSQKSLRELFHTWAIHHGLHHTDTKISLKKILTSHVIATVTFTGESENDEDFRNFLNTIFKKIPGYMQLHSFSIEKKPSSTLFLRFTASCIICIADEKTERAHP